MSRLALVAAVLCALALFGCGKKDETTVSAPGGTVTVNKQGTEVAATGEKGTTEVKGGDSGVTMKHTGAEGTTTAATGSKADMSEMGLATYPGATVEDAGGAQAAIDTPQGKQYTMALITTDSVDKVVEFYKKELQSASAMTMPDGGTISGKTKGGDDAVVVVAKDEAKTKIGINVTKKKQ